MGRAREPGNVNSADKRPKGSLEAGEGVLGKKQTGKKSKNSVIYWGQSDDRKMPLQEKGRERTTLTKTSSTTQINKKNNLLKQGGKETLGQY